MLIVGLAFSSVLLFCGDVFGVFIGLLSLMLGGMNMVLNTSFGLDYENWWFMLISWMMLGGMYYLKNKVLYLMILMSMNLFFISLKLVDFFIFFELTVLPMFVVVYSYGYNPERLDALYYLGVYSLVGSIPLLMLVLYSTDGVVGGLLVNLSLVGCWMKYKKNQLLIFFMLSFLMKMAIFGFHLWLPKVHVEASTEGSMILAALLLKMGVWGFCFLKISFGLENVVSMVGLVGGMYIVLLVLGCLICFVSSDSKVFMAYSSINHMTVLVIILLVLGQWGVDSVMIMSLAHAFVSCSLFCFVGSLGSFIGSRSLYLSYGMMLASGLGSLLVGLALFFNCSTPPSMKYVGEITVIYGLLYYLGMSGVVSVVLNNLLVGLVVIYFYMVFWHSNKSGWMIDYCLNRCYVVVFYNLMWCIIGVCVIGSMV